MPAKKKNPPPVKQGTFFCKRRKPSSYFFATAVLVLVVLFDFVFAAGFVVAGFAGAGLPFGVTEAGLDGCLPSS